SDPAHRSLPASGIVRVACRDETYFRTKLTVTVMSTSTGWSFNIVGVYFHFFTASIAAASNRGWDRNTRTSFTVPSRPIVASRITLPLTLACLAMGGY